MSLPLWEECAWVRIPSPVRPSDETTTIDDGVSKLYPFEVDEDINQKIYLYQGSGYKIPASAIIVGQNEQLSDRSEDNGAIFALGGPSLEDEVQLSAPVQTGDSCATTGGNLPYDFVIHSVAPRYDARYLTASEQALFAAYKSALLLAVEKSARDLIITCIYTKRKRYPRDEAAHVALRTIRKFLQHTAITSCFQRVMFCVPSAEDYDIYSTLMLAYFPRNAYEQSHQSGLLPPNLGDEWGEIKLADRELKVSAGPKPLSEDTLQEYRTTNLPPRVPTEDGSRESFAGRSSLSSSSYMNPPAPNETAKAAVVKSMIDLGDDDAQRDEARRAKVAQQLQQMTRQEKMQLRFARLAEELAHEVAEITNEGDAEALEDYHRSWRTVEALEILEFLGKDKMDRTVVLVNAHKMRLPSSSPSSSSAGQVATSARKTYDVNDDDPYDYFANNSVTKQVQQAQPVDYERITLYFLRVLEALSCRPFVLVYAMSGISNGSTAWATTEIPDPTIAQTFFDLVDARFAANLQKFYVLHPSFFYYMSAWATLPYASLSIWKNVRWAKRMGDMAKYLDLEKLNWPPEILAYEASLDA